MSDNEKSFKTEKEIAAFCKKEIFKQCVRQAINDELFWKDILQKYSVASIVREEMAREIPGKVKTEVGYIVPDLVEKKLNNFIANPLAAHIAKELNNQVPAFLANNYQMQQILASHSTNLNGILERAANDILNRIVHDPTHHELAQQHLQAIDAKGEAKIAEVNTRCQQMMVDHGYNFNTQVSAMKKQCDAELSELKDKLQKMEIFSKTLNDQQCKLRELQLQSINSNFWLNFNLINSLLSLGISIYLVVKVMK